MSDAVIVDACRRRGLGGSPTAVLDDEDSLTDAERSRVPAIAGTSHAVFVREIEAEIEVEVGGEFEGVGNADRPAFALRFFTTEGELPACGHGTVAAVALLAERSGGDQFQAHLRAATRRFEGWAVREGGRLAAAFDPGPVDLRAPKPEELEAVAAGLGIAVGGIAEEACVASVGRERMLLPLASRSALAELAPNFAQLKEACDRFGFLGCYAYSVPEADGLSAARMFAPSIGVPEDIANANSTGCLAAYLAGRGVARLSVDMGDHLGSPSTITATVHDGPSGRQIRLGGEAAGMRSISV
ncbi:PhzF family phenazine biosynthesis protein [Actinospica sp.]|uniref:PhzF family phenazine biosynthesis protein n=1 Tax=Actinospica sp. TaxID=1872142 RepID=UPI002B5E73BB|nr:PhzF family phenazine biosynthesis protein [Actinospica sp.]HWG24297.1 PhzF family phenazine biosynthesis protein [Actinospica sp.]